MCECLNLAGTESPSPCTCTCTCTCMACTCMWVCRVCWPIITHSRSLDLIAMRLDSPMTLASTVNGSCYQLVRLARGSWERVISVCLHHNSTGIAAIMNHYVIYKSSLLLLIILNLYIIGNIADHARNVAGWLGLLVLYALCRTRAILLW